MPSREVQCLENRVPLFVWLSSPSETCARIKQALYISFISASSALRRKTTAAAAAANHLLVVSHPHEHAPDPARSCRFRPRVYSRLFLSLLQPPLPSPSSSSSSSLCPMYVTATLAWTPDRSRAGLAVRSQGASFSRAPAPHTLSSSGRLGPGTALVGSAAIVAASLAAPLKLLQRPRQKRLVRSTRPLCRWGWVAAGHQSSALAAGGRGGDVCAGASRNDHRRDVHRRAFRVTF